MSEKMDQISFLNDGYYEPSEDEKEVESSSDDYERSETEKMSPPVENFHRRKGRKHKFKKKDPLMVCGFDNMLMILSYLDAHSLASSLVVSSKWRTVASSDTLWSKKCEELWADKAHLPHLPQIERLSKLFSYSLSVKDGKRNRIMKEDLWDHVWEFHFKEDTPEYWRNLDPFWIGTHPPMRRYFHRDGSQTADFGDPIWGGHESCYSIITSVLSNGKIREHYVRINRWPQMRVSRRQDWGWEMSNQIYCYSSVPDAYKKGGTGPYIHAT